MTPIINSSSNKHPMSWEIIHCRLIHPSYSVIKSIYRHQNLTGLPKHCPKNLNQAPYTIVYAVKIKPSPKVTTVDTNKPQLGEFIHIFVALNNVTSIHRFTEMLNVVCSKTIIIWVLPTAFRQSSVHVIQFIIITLNI